MGLASLGYGLPVEALFLGLLPVGLDLSRKAGQPGGQGLRGDKALLATLPPAEFLSTEELWGRLCTAGNVFTGALATWAFVLESESWVEVARAGDARPLDPDLPSRLQGPPGSRQAQDLAYLALPVPHPSRPIGLLVLQPGDKAVADPWRLLGGAMEQVERGILAQESEASPHALRLLGLGNQLRAFRGLEAIQQPCMLFDAFGWPLSGGGEFREAVGLSCAAKSDLCTHWKALGGEPATLALLGSKKGGLDLSFQGHSIRLQAGIHAGRVECYILKVEKAERRSSEAQTQDSPC
jgi:hypothetical protein